MKHLKLGVGGVFVDGVELKDMFFFGVGWL